MKNIINMKRFVVAHNNYGFAYVREVIENPTDIQLGVFSTETEAYSFIETVDPQLEADWWEAEMEADAQWVAEMEAMEE